MEKQTDKELETVFNRIDEKWCTDKGSIWYPRTRSISNCNIISDKKKYYLIIKEAQKGMVKIEDIEKMMRFSNESIKQELRNYDDHSPQRYIKNFLFADGSNFIIDVICGIIKKELEKKEKNE